MSLLPDSVISDIEDEILDLKANWYVWTTIPGRSIRRT
jgi:hypothetical protein